MEIKVTEDVAQINMTHAELQRLCISIREGYSGLSRAEYYIRTGLSSPALHTLVDELKAALSAAPATVTLALEQGVEEVENPRRPRPPQ